MSIKMTACSVTRERQARPGAVDHRPTSAMLLLWRGETGDSPWLPRPRSPVLGVSVTPGVLNPLLSDRAAAGRSPSITSTARAESLTSGSDRNRRIRVNPRICGRLDGAAAPVGLLRVESGQENGRRHGEGFCHVSFSEYSQPMRRRSRRSRANFGSPRKRRPSRYAMVISVIVGCALVATTLTLLRPLIQRAALTASDGSSGPLFGALIPNRSWLATTTAEFGHMPIIRSPYAGLPTPNAWTTDPAGANKSAVIVSFTAPPGAVLSGADDAALLHFFHAAPTGRTVYYSFDSQPEAAVLAHHFSAARYRAAWLHIIALARRAHHNNLKPTLILKASDLAPNSGVVWTNFLPSSAKNYTVGWIAYPAGARTRNLARISPGHVPGSGGAVPRRTPACLSGSRDSACGPPTAARSGCIGWRTILWPAGRCLASSPTVRPTREWS